MGAKNVKTWLRTAVLALGVVGAAQAVVIGGGYIAGSGFSLAQAIADAKREHPAGSSQGFWIVVMGAELGSLARNTASADLLADLTSLQQRGGVVFVCERDLNAAGLTAQDLIPGVQVVRGWTAAESGMQDNGDAGSTNDDTTPLSPLRAVDRLCSQNVPASDGE